MVGSPNPTGRRKGPIRTCRGCRRRQPVQELISLAGSPGTAPRVTGLAGLRKRAESGRGAWCCPERDCVVRTLRPWLGRSGSRNGVDVAAAALRQEALDLALSWTQRRRDGLRRRRLDGDDRRVLAWKAIAGRLAASSRALP